MRAKLPGVLGRTYPLEPAVARIVVGIEARAPPVYAQNSSLEIAWTRVVTERRDIAGTRVVPFLTDDAEGFTIDYPDDWDQAERWAASGEATLPDVTVTDGAGGR